MVKSSFTVITNGKKRLLAVQIAENVPTAVIPLLLHF